MQYLNEINQANNVNISINIINNRVTKNEFVPVKYTLNNNNKKIEYDF